jgi:hypothetical protein
MHAQRRMPLALMCLATVCLALVLWHAVDAARARACLDGTGERGWLGSTIIDGGCVARYVDRTELVPLSGPSLAAAIAAGALCLVSLAGAALITRLRDRA